MTNAYNRGIRPSGQVSVTPNIDGGCLGDDNHVPHEFMEDDTTMR